ncbi:MAG: cytochrome c oxidase subunit II [Alphaproteobacteria bacterium]|nr:cytochrome c oxidase subunit II [Alphaproteobacteria bacterium]
MGLQESASPIMDKIHDLHNLLMVIISAIAVVITALLVFVVLRFRASKNPVPSKRSHNTLLEIIWTLIPVCILAVIAVPSFKLMYFADQPVKADVTVKVTGHQWYWSYEFPDQGINFDSYMIKDEELKPGQLRLLEVDNPLILPIDTMVRILVTSADVLHSWAVPSMGLKQDSVPGRTREIWVKIKREGVYYGQCSELCGMQHGFMPISIHAVQKDKFNEWLSKNKKQEEPAKIVPAVLTVMGKDETRKG